LVAIRRASSRVKSCLAHFQSESPHPSGHGSRMHSSVLRWPAARTDCICFRQSLYGSRFIQNVPYRIIRAAHRIGIIRRIFRCRISDHLWGDLYHQSVSVDRVLVFQRSSQNRPIVIGHSHRTGFDLRLATKRAPANASNLSLDTTPLSSLQLNADKMAVGKPNFEVVAASIKNVFSRSSFVSGE